MFCWVGGNDGIIDIDIPDVCVRCEFHRPAARDGRGGYLWSNNTAEHHMCVMSIMGMLCVC